MPRKMDHQVSRGLVQPNLAGLLRTGPIFRSTLMHRGLSSPLVCCIAPWYGHKYSGCTWRGRYQGEGLCGILQEENQAMSKLLRQSSGALSSRKSLSQPLPPIPRDSDASPSGDAAPELLDAARSGVGSGPAAASADVPLSTKIAEGLLKGGGASPAGPGWDALPPGLQRLLPRPQTPGAPFHQIGGWFFHVEQSSALLPAELPRKLPCGLS